VLHHVMEHLVIFFGHAIAPLDIMQILEGVHRLSFPLFGIFEFDVMVPDC